MINSVTFKVISREHGKNGDVSLNAQVFVNKQRVVIPLSIYIQKKLFDAGAQRVKHQCPQCIQYNSIIANAQDRTARILAEANEKNIRLDRQGFRIKFTTTLSDEDFVQFWEQEHQARKGSIESGTWKTHKESLKKFKEFKTSVPFSMLGPELVEEYKRYLRRRGNGINTIATALTILKTYSNLAILKGIDIKNPFRHHRISKAPGRRIFLTVQELHRALELYDSRKLDPPLQESLLTFLVQSFTSLRISDAKALDHKWIIDNVLDFMPKKGRSHNKNVRFGLSKVAVRLVRDFLKMKSERRIKAEPQINIDLKVIGALLGLKKSITTHVGRHTFATTFVHLGGQTHVLKEIMGHARIETTEIYVHLVDEIKTEQMGNFDNEFK